jgi:hypothetical protein
MHLPSIFVRLICFNKTEICTLSLEQSNLEVTFWKVCLQQVIELLKKEDVDDIQRKPFVVIKTMLIIRGSPCNTL